MSWPANTREKAFPFWRNLCEFPARENVTVKKWRNLFESLILRFSAGGSWNGMEAFTPLKSLLNVGICWNEMKMACLLLLRRAFGFFEGLECFSLRANGRAEKSQFACHHHLVAIPGSFLPFLLFQPIQEKAKKERRSFSWQIPFSFLSILLPTLSSAVSFSIFGFVRRLVFPKPHSIALLVSKNSQLISFTSRSVEQTFRKIWP